MGSGSSLSLISKVRLTITEDNFQVAFLLNAEVMGKYFKYPFRHYPHLTFSNSLPQKSWKLLPHVSFSLSLSEPYQQVDPLALN